MRGIGLQLTSSPVQKVGHLVQGSSLAFKKCVLKYGLRTISGRVGGVRTEAPTRLAVSTEAAAAVKGVPGRILR